MKKWFWLLGVIVVSLVTLLVVGEIEPPNQTQKKGLKQTHPKVSVSTYFAADYAGEVSFYGEVSALSNAKVRAHVRGEVVKILPKMKAGEKVKKGQRLLHIEDSQYRMAVAEAKQLLAEAELNLLQENKRAEQARRNWTRAGLKGKPDDLALNKPQVALAKANMVTARSRLKAAETTLSYTEIKAPFNGFVTERKVSIGETVEAGTDLYHLVGSDQLEIKVNLSETQFDRLPEGWQTQRVNLYDLQGKSVGTALLKRGGGYLDPVTRLHPLYLESTALDGVLPGDFVKASLPTQVFASVLRLPETALTRKGFIWFVDDQDRLQKFRAQVLFYEENWVVVSVPEALRVEETQSNELPDVRIAVTPLSYFEVGKQVAPSLIEPTSMEATR